MGVISSRVEFILFHCAQELVQGHTHMAVDYLQELSQWASEDFYVQNAHKFQLPYTAVSETLIVWIYIS